LPGARTSPSASPPNRVLFTSTMRRASCGTGTSALPATSARKSTMTILRGKEFLSRRVCFGLGLFLQLLINAPLMAEGIDKLPIARAPEHILHRHDDFGAARHRSGYHFVGVVGHQRDADARAAQSLRRLA